MPTLQYTILFAQHEHRKTALKSFTTRITRCLAYNPLLSTKRVVKMITNIEREEEMRKSRRFRDSSNLQVSIYYTSLSSGLQRHFLYNKVCPSFRFLSEFCQFAEKSTSLLFMYVPFSVSLQTIFISYSHY